jgi:hypothetical protein
LPASNLTSFAASAQAVLIPVSAGFLRIATDRFVMTPGSLHGSAIVVVL